MRANVSLSSPTMDMDEDLFDDVVADKTYTPLPPPHERNSRFIDQGQ